MPEKPVPGKSMLEDSVSDKSMSEENIPENDTHFELHLPVEESILAVDLLASNCSLSKQQLKQVMQKGAVWVTPDQQGVKATQRLRRAKKALKVGDYLHLYYDREILISEPTPTQLVSDLGDYSVWNKPYGIYSQGSKWGDHCTVARWAEQHLKPERPAFVVHRLDRATNGLILLAHSKRAVKALGQLFEGRQLEKCYRALVHGEFPGSRHTVRSAIDGRSACSHFQREHYYPEHKMSLVNVQIDTGRKHQIRRHLAEFGFPVVGDRLHGKESDALTGFDLQLCAYRLRFCCPITNEERHFELAEGTLPWVKEVP